MEMMERDGMRSVFKGSGYDDRDEWHKLQNVVTVAILLPQIPLLGS